MWTVVQSDGLRRSEQSAKLKGLFATFIASIMLNPSVLAEGSRKESSRPTGALSKPMTHTLSLDVRNAPFLTVQDVSRLLGITVVTVYRLVARRALPAYRFLRRIRFLREDVLAWVEAKRIHPPRF